MSTDWDELIQRGEAKIARISEAIEFLEHLAMGETMLDRRLLDILIPLVALRYELNFNVQMARKMQSQKSEE